MAKKIINSKSEEQMETSAYFPVLQLRDIVVYPHMIVPLYLGRAKSIHALEACMNKSTHIFLLTQKDPKIDEPTPEDLYEIGTVGNVLQVLKLPDNTIKLLVEGLYRAKVKEFVDDKDILFVKIEPTMEEAHEPSEIDALVRSILNRFEEYVKLNGKIPVEILSALSSMNDQGRLADTIAAHMPLKLEEKQKILSAEDSKLRLELVSEFLEREIEVLLVEENLRNRVRNQVDKTQREYYLNEKLKAIQKELDDLGDGKHPTSDLAKLKQKIEEVGLTAEAKEKAMHELDKLRMMSPMSPEASVSRIYLDWLVSLPWVQKSDVNKDLGKAEETLEKDHYGLEKVKERILEYLAVQERAEKVKGPILCLVGPPGVGKTSLGQSIARATGREFVRISLGGVRDEAEIRGHRRTYIGSLPGKIIQKMAKVKVRNPLFMLDEVDKMSMDFRGDPASALLEVLDPEQNNTFNDHYLEVDYDLSDVMFIATANSLDIPDALLDRMEVIRIAGYTEDEKLHIATKYLIPKQVAENGLKPKEISFLDEAVVEIIRYYTREAGVRNLEREIAKICRKVVRDILRNKETAPIVVAAADVEKYLGVKIFYFGATDKKNQIGQVHGLAWTEVGGDLLTIEAVVIPGKGKTIYTGHLGEIMQESIHAALTVVKSRSKMLGIDKDFSEKSDIHVHVPEGATPKDGPSAGISMCTALVSAVTKIPVRADVAMTGEITLRGEVLPIGGLKEKLLAALRGGIKTVIIPEENIKDLKEMPKNITEALDIKPVKWIDQVLEIALEHLPKPRSKSNSKSKSKPKSKSRNAKAAKTKKTTRVQNAKSKSRK